MTREWTDHDDVLCAEWLQRTGIPVGKDIVGQAVEAVAHERGFHPGRAYLTALAWDRTPRIDRLFINYFGAEDTPYHRAIGAKFLIGAVARIMRPGCKVDTMPVLEGAQGIGKSRGLRVLVGDAWFADQMPDLGSKDAMVQMQGKWVIELAELDAMSKVETTRIKAFVSSPTDRFRSPYGKRARDFPRQCVFVGTTNTDAYLKDGTGARRFWPVACGAAVDVEAIVRDRDQLWAEATCRFGDGESWWLDDPALVRAAAVEQADRYDADPWQEKVEKFISDKSFVTVSDVLERALGLEAGRWTKREANRVGATLRSLAWTRDRAGRTNADGRRPWVFRCPEGSAFATRLLAEYDERATGRDDSF